MILPSQIHTPYRPRSLVDINAKRELSVYNVGVLHHLLEVQKGLSSFINTIDYIGNVKGE